MTPIPGLDTVVTSHQCDSIVRCVAVFGLEAVIVRSNRSAFCGTQMA